MVTLGQPALDGQKPADDDQRMWSVTTIIGALDKPALLYWAAEQTAICAVDQLATVQAMVSDGDRADVIKWLRDARFRRPKGERTAAEKIRNIEVRIDQLNKVADALRQLVHRCECGGQDMPCPIIRMALTP